MTGPIRNRPIQPGQPVQPTAPQAETTAHKKVTEFGAVHPASERVGQSLRQNFDAVRARIQDGLKRGLDKSAILKELARGELSEMFGGKVTDRMVQAVADAVAGDPNFAQMYSKLFNRASSEQA